LSGNNFAGQGEFARASIGTITEDNLRFLIDQFEEESDDDQDQYLNEATLDLFEKGGADTA